MPAAGEAVAGAAATRWHLRTLGGHDLAALVVLQIDLEDMDFSAFCPCSQDASDLPKINHLCDAFLPSAEVGIEVPLDVVDV